MHRKRTGDSYTLLLTAGELRRIGIRFLHQTDFPEQCQGFFLGLHFGQTEQVYRCICDILQDGHVLEEVETLEHHAYLLPHLMERITLGCNQFAIDVYLTRGGRFEHVQRPQERTLTCSGRTDQTDDLALVHLKTDVAENF